MGRGKAPGGASHSHSALIEGRECVTLDERLKTYGPTWARIALSNIDREFPNAFMVLADGPDDLNDLRPRVQHPAFYGSYDWHSAVEMHWVLVRLARLRVPRIPLEAIKNALDEHLSQQAVQQELAFFALPSRHAWERPYGWAWVLKLTDELAQWQDGDAKAWLSALAPLAEWIAEELSRWLDASPYPVRHGLHANSAFSLDLAWRWAVRQGEALQESILHAARRWYLNDGRDAYGLEPSGSDFLSPTLSEASLMASVLGRQEFIDWAAHFLDPARLRALAEPFELPDPSDGQASHLYGLHFSRAYAFQQISRHLPDNHEWQPQCRQATHRLIDHALPASTGRHYFLDHWLPAFALLAVTAEA